MNDKKRICASTARSEYRLTDSDLRTLDVRYKQRQCDIEHVDEISAQRAAARLALTKQATQKASELVGGFKATAIARQGSSPLPIDLWERILGMLVEGLETHGIRGPSVVSRDICNASAACLAMHAAVHSAWRVLASKCQQLGTSVDWDTLVREPQSFKLSDLKFAARQLSVQVTGTKPVLILRILKAFHLQHPVNVPARVLAAVRAEFVTLPKDYAQLWMKFLRMVAWGDAACMGATDGNRNLYAFRRCLAAAYPTSDALEARYLEIEAVEAPRLAAKQQTAV